jgi:hypothetical protein
VVAFSAKCHENPSRAGRTRPAGRRLAGRRLAGRRLAGRRLAGCQCSWASPPVARRPLVYRCPAYLLLSAREATSLRDSLLAANNAMAMAITFRYNNMHLISNRRRTAFIGQIRGCPDLTIWAVGRAWVAAEMVSGRRAAGPAPGWPGTAADLRWPGTAADWRWPGTAADWRWPGDSRRFAMAGDSRRSAAGTAPRGDPGPIQAGAGGAKWGIAEIPTIGGSRPPLCSTQFELRFYKHGRQKPGVVTVDGGGMWSRVERGGVR